MAFKYDGRQRPPFAVSPGEGQESVWDYPRPPRLEPETREVVVRVGDAVVARTNRAVRVLETASPPTIYIPVEDVRVEWLEPVPGTSWCEWKGGASYWDVAVPGLAPLAQAAWGYPNPSSAFAAIRGFVSFYPSRLACSVGGVLVSPQPGRFYGGWMTPEIVGPVKGDPGTEWW